MGNVDPKNQHWPWCHGALFIQEEKEEEKKITRKSKSVTEYAVVQQQKNAYLVQRNVEGSLLNDIVELLRICQICFAFFNKAMVVSWQSVKVFASVLLAKQSAAWVEHEHHLMLYSTLQTKVSAGKLNKKQSLHYTKMDFSKSESNIDIYLGVGNIQWLIICRK